MMDESTKKMLEELQEDHLEHYQEMLRRHNEIVSELRNLVTAVKELTELIRNTR